MLSYYSRLNVSHKIISRLSVNMSNRILNFVGISYLKVAQHHNSCDE